MVERGLGVFNAVGEGVDSIESVAAVEEVTRRRDGEAVERLAEGVRKAHALCVFTPSARWCVDQHLAEKSASQSGQ